MSMRSPGRRPAIDAGPPGSTDVTCRLNGLEEEPALAPHQPRQGTAPPNPVALNHARDFNERRNDADREKHGPPSYPSHGRRLCDAYSTASFTAKNAHSRIYFIFAAAAASIAATVASGCITMLGWLPAGTCERCAFARVAIDS